MKLCICKLCKNSGDDQKQSPSAASPSLADVMFSGASITSDSALRPFSCVSASVCPCVLLTVLLHQSGV